MRITSAKVGDRFSRLTILELHSGSHTRGTKATCRCECGTVKTIWLSHVTRGRIRSCGCLLRETSKLNAEATHRQRGFVCQQGQSSTRAYSSWKGMLRRCNDPQNPHFHNYGGRGIGVCERWLKFENFLIDMGERPVGLTLERVNNVKGYSPENCKWATRREQQNNRRTNRVLVLNGRAQTITQWANELGVSVSVLQYRYRAG